MYDTPKFKLAFPLCNTGKFIFKISILFDKSHFKEGNLFVGHPVENFDEIKQQQNRYGSRDEIRTIFWLLVVRKKILWAI